MNKNLLLLMMMFLVLSSCSILGRDDKKEEALPLAPNTYLWNATLDELSFLPVQTEDEKIGFYKTSWAAMRNSKAEEYKVSVQILASSLRSDSIHVKVYKRLQSSGCWSEAVLNEKLTQKVKLEILHKARDLYKKSLIK